LSAAFDLNNVDDPTPRARAVLRTIPQERDARAHIS
jgi:hypothetical protein